jgi:hypothetical protein
MSQIFEINHQTGETNDAYILMHYDFLLNKPPKNKQLFFIQRYESYLRRFNTVILPTYTRFLKQCKDPYQKWAIVILMVSSIIYDELHRMEDMSVNEDNYSLINDTSTGGRNCLSATVLHYMYLYKLKDIGYPINICLLDDHIYLGIGKHNEFVLEYHSDPLSYTIDNDSYLKIKNEMDMFITTYPQFFSFFIKHNNPKKPEKINKQYINLMEMEKCTLPCAVQKYSVKKLLYLMQNMTYSHITLNDVSDIKQTRILFKFYQYIFHTFIDSSLNLSNLSKTNGGYEWVVNGESKDLYTFILSDFLSKWKIKYNNDEFAELFFIPHVSSTPKRMSTVEEYIKNKNTHDKYRQYNDSGSSSK